VLFVVFAVSGYANLGHAVKINIVIPVLIGLLFILLGNYMGKLKKNWFIGIRTPWTLSSENVWNRTHRVGGRLMAFFGVVVIVTPFLPKAIGTGVFLAGIILCVVGSFAYSYFAYRQEISGTGPTQNPDK
ncbi:MAG: SdpI family protein, partial [Candidatus Saccharibacteria bacterium]